LQFIILHIAHVSEDGFYYILLFSHPCLATKFSPAA